MTAFSMRLTMLSDWHVGTGTGRRGFTNSMVTRDASGLPYIPAKTITGVWRDACEVAANALDGGGAGPWHDWTEYLFGSQPALSEAGTSPVGDGSPKEAALGVRSLHYPAGLGTVLTARPRLAAAATFVKPGVSVDRVTGRAGNRLLRFDEMARVGAVLTGTAEIIGYQELEEDQQRCVAALLLAGAELLEGVGGKRRRGTGRCRLELDGIEADLGWLAELDNPPPAPSRLGPLAAGGTCALPGPRPAVREWEIAELRLELRTPVVVHERTVGNAVRSMDYVPGSVFLPTVLQRLGAAAQAGQESAAAEAARAGDLIVTNATIELGGRPGRPVPRILARHRGSGVGGDRGLLRNQANQPYPEWFHPEPIESGYIGPYEPGIVPEIRTVALSEQAHNTIDDSVQRPTEAVGGLYTYQAIRTGTVLRAEVRVPTGLLTPGWQAELEGNWRIGRSSKDDYGLVNVTVTGSTARPRPARPDDPAPISGSLRVWLLSDMLVAGERLRPSCDPRDIGAALGDALAVTLTPAARRDGLTCAVVSSERRTESWHRRWGLPRPTLLGLAGGSYLAFDITGPRPSREALQRVELTGIGLRRAEGFGQVLIDDPLLYAIFGQDRPGDGSHAGENAMPGPDLAVPDVAAPQLSPAAAEAVRAFEEAAWLQAIREESEAVASTDAGRRRVLGDGVGDVPSAQLGALLMVTATLSGQASDSATHWLGRLDATKGREGSWPVAVQAQLTRLLTDPEAVWEALKLPEAELASSAVAGRELKRRLRAQAIRIVVADCLTALRRSREERHG
jgi:CRISPR-associated protein Csx10